MIEIRGHGRGGMGTITMMELLAKAAGYDNKYAQAFPSFGPERRGAPVKAFCRIDDFPITIRSQIYEPDYVIVLDPSLLNLPDVLEGLKKDSVLIINNEKSVELKQKTYVYDATSLALKILGKDIVNTAMLGVFVKITGLVSLESVLKALGERFGGKIFELNKKLVTEAYSGVG
jgi:pyruvate ferredoxin oxidoreductase gamma subunit